MAKKKSVAGSSLMPDGFEPISTKLTGWYTVEEGNEIQGFLRDVFTVTGKFGPKKVYKVELTKGGTRAINPDKGEFTAEEGDLIGIDEKGWLKGLGTIEVGREIFIRCTGQEETAKKGQSPAWTFVIGAVPI